MLCPSLCITLPCALAFLAHYPCALPTWRALGAGGHAGGHDSDGSASSGSSAHSDPSIPGMHDGHTKGAVRACEPVCLRSYLARFLSVSPVLTSSGPAVLGASGGFGGGKGIARTSAHLLCCGQSEGHLKHPCPSIGVVRG